MRRMRVLLLAGLASLALGAARSHAQVHVFLPPIPLPQIVFSVPPPVVVDVHPVPPPRVYYGPPVRYRYVEHHYHEPRRYHHKHKYDRHHRKHHRYDDDD